MFLKDLLENDHPLFTTNLRHLERATGDAGVDTRLIADTTEKAYQVMRSLGLDPADTTGVELYNTLKNSVKNGQLQELLQETDYVLLNLGDGPVSFNRQDVIENAHHELAYPERHSGHGKRHLRLEIVKRYAEHDRTSGELVHKLAEEIGLEQPQDNDYPSVGSAISRKPTLLAIGDIFTDVFIKLSDKYARVDVDTDGRKRLSLPFGTKPPYEQAESAYAVGPSPNAAVSCARLGVDVSLMAWLGDDETGRKSLEYLQKEGINVTPVVVKENTPSSTYYVLRLNADRTILVKNQDFDYAWRPPKEEPEWIYLSLLSDKSWQLHQDLLAYLKEHPKVKLAFQPGTFHFEWGTGKLVDIYRRSYIVVMNREEAADVTGKSTESLLDLAGALHKLGPEIVVITDGPDGAYAYHNGQLTQIPNYPDPAPPLERTGAGDAFASTVVAALALGKPIETALRWAPVNSMSVVQKIGAQAGLLNQQKIEEWLEKAPSDYKTKELK